MQLLAGQFRFSTIKTIGRGGLGVVSEICVTETNGPFPIGTRLAQKRLNAHWAQNPTMLQRFEREIAALKRMSHPAILRVAGENLSGSERFYCMRLYTKGSLRQWIASATKAPTIREAAGFISSIADALHYAHGQGFHHRDIKPENILLDDTNAPVVADWGLGYFVHQNSLVMTSLTRGGMGTEYYCSAEQWATGKGGAAGDVYSLGMTLAEVLTGHQNPIPHVGAGITTDIIPSISPAAVAMNRLIRDMTHTRHGNRISRMDFVRDSLRRIAR